MEGLMSQIGLRNPKLSFAVDCYWVLKVLRVLKVREKFSFLFTCQEMLTEILLHDHVGLHNPLNWCLHYLLVHHSMKQNTWRHSPTDTAPTLYSPQYA